jgi:hypothetical protein
MRVYLPATIADLATDPLSARPAFAVTAALRSLFADEDTEYLEAIAFLAAADAALERLGTIEPAEPAPDPWRRVVVAADIPADATAPPPGPDPHPAAINLTATVPWRRVAAFHIDELAASSDIQLALAGDTAAIDRLEERDLLWFVPSERATVLAQAETPDIRDREANGES